MPPFELEPWQFNSIIAVVLTYWIVIGGWAAAKAGRSPLWALALLVPWLNIAVVWLFAFARWPFVDSDAPAGDQSEESSSSAGTSRPE